MVVIVVDPELGFKEGNMKAIDCSREPCHHLRGEKVGEFSCAIHDKPWYKKTPCFSHGQIERSEDDECRTGRYFLDKASKE